MVSRGIKSSIPSLFAPWSEANKTLANSQWPFRSLVNSFPGLFTTWNFPSREQKFYKTFVPWNFRSQNVYLTVYWTKVDRRPTLFSVFRTVTKFFLFLLPCVGLHDKRWGNKKHDKEKRKIYSLLERCLYHIWQRLIAHFCFNNNISLEYRHSMQYSQGECRKSMSWT